MHEKLHCLDGMSLFRIKLTSDLTIESFLADSGTIEFPHYKSIFFNEISDSLFSIFNLMKPFVLIDMTLYDVNLGLQNLLYAATRFDHTRLNLRPLVILPRVGAQVLNY